MGQDYAERKASKRKRRPGRNEAAEPPADADGKKNRPKRAKVRRICRSLCYQEPVLASDDTQWREKDGNPPLAERRAAAAALAEQANKGRPSKGSEALPAGSSRARKRRRKEGSSTRLSTAVDLGKAFGSSAETVQAPSGNPEALAQYPQPIAAFMAAQGYHEPNAVQRRHVSSKLHASSARF